MNVGEIPLQAQLKRAEMDVQQMIHERQLKVEEIKKSVDHYKVSPHPKSQHWATCQIVF